MWPVPGDNGCGDGVRVGIDSEDRPVQAVRHPRGVVTEGDPRRAVPDVDRAHLLPARRIDANHPARGMLARPQCACAEGELGRGDRKRLGRPVAVGIDPRDRAGAAVRDPDRAGRVDDPERPAPDVDRLDDRVRAGVDPRNRAVEAVDHPNGTGTGCNPARAVANPNRLYDGVRCRVDAGHRVAVGVGDPICTFASRDRRGCCADADARDKATRARLEDAQRVAGRRDGRAAASTMAEHHQQNHHRGSDHAGEHREHNCSASPRPSLACLLRPQR